MRRSAGSVWLSAGPLELIRGSEVRTRAEELVSLGFGKFDSLHLASAELAAAEVFGTVYYPLISRASRQKSKLAVRVLDPLRLAEEVFREFTHH